MKAILTRYTANTYEARTRIEEGKTEHKVTCTAGPMQAARRLALKYYGIAAANTVSGSNGIYTFDPSPLPKENSAVISVTAEIVWLDATSDVFLPDELESVILYTASDVGEAYLEDGEWRWANGTPVAESVGYWARFPEHPAA